jgi:hypothetical protein
MDGATNMAHMGMEGSKRCSHWRTISSERRRMVSAAAFPPGICVVAVMRTQGCGVKVASIQSAPEKPGGGWGLVRWVGGRDEVGQWGGGKGWGVQAILWWLWLSM